MSVVNEAARVIVHANTQRRNRRGWQVVDIVTIQAATEYAEALQAAGLLADRDQEETV